MTENPLRAALEEISALCIAPRTPIFKCYDIARAALAAPVETAPEQKPVGYAFQHGETGRMTCVTPEEYDDGWFEKMNSRWHLVGPLYLATPQQAAPEQTEPQVWSYDPIHRKTVTVKWPTSDNFEYLDFTRFDRDALPQQAAPEQATDLHAAIMNLPCPIAYAQTKEAMALRKEYIAGFRDARHAAAELAAAAPVAQQAAPEQENYDWCPQCHYYEGVIDALECKVAQQAAPEQAIHDGEVIASTGSLSDAAIIKWVSSYRPQIGDKIYAAPIAQQRDESKGETT